MEEVLDEWNVEWKVSEDGVEGSRIDAYADVCALTVGVLLGCASQGRVPR